MEEVMARCVQQFLSILLQEIKAQSVGSFGHIVNRCLVKRRNISEQMFTRDVELCIVLLLMFAWSDWLELREGDPPLSCLRSTLGHWLIWFRIF